MTQPPPDSWFEDWHSGLTFGFLVGAGFVVGAHASGDYWWMSLVTLLALALFTGVIYLVYRHRRLWARRPASGSSG
jgi:hypothetical protein